MRQLCIVFSLLIILAAGCKSSYKVVLTGTPQPPLTEKDEVKVLAWGQAGDYIQIGIVDVGDYSLEKRIELAKKVARLSGGNIIMPKLEHDPSKDEKKKSYILQKFLILRAKTDEEKMAEEAAGKLMVSKKGKTEDTGEEEGGEEAKDYSKLPRAKYKLLIEDVASLKGEKFQGSLYPIRFYNIPRNLREHTGKNKKLLLLSTRSGKSKVLLIIPKSTYKKFSAMAKSNKKLKFVYTPVTVYKSKYPVLEYIDEIK